MSGWRALTTDPNSRAALAARQAALERAWCPPVASRIDHLREHAAGRRVLDVGVVDHELEQHASTAWLHGHIAAVASYCLGVDLLEGPIEELGRRGYNVRRCDITRDPLDETFDVVIAGEVIEHLGSPAELVRAARRVLAPGGRLIFTTPNPYELGRVLHELRGHVRDNVDHVVAFSPAGVVELLEREGFVLDQYRGVARRRGGRDLRRDLNRRLKEAAARLLFRPEAACETLIYHGVRA